MIMILMVNGGKDGGDGRGANDVRGRTVAGSGNVAGIAECASVANCAGTRCEVSSLFGNFDLELDRLDWLTINHYKEQTNITAS
jgi:hypothetical protein